MIAAVFDLETGGTSEKHSVLQVGAVAFNIETGEVLDSFEVYHKLPRMEDYVIDPESIEKHNINVKTCFTLGKTKEEITSLFSDLYYKNNCVLLAGHNVVGFDIPRISKQIFGIEVEDFYQNFTYRTLDSHPVIRLFAGVEDMKQGSTLKQTAKSLGIDLTDLGGQGFHSALYDCMVTARILHKFRRVLSLPSVVKMLTGQMQ